MADTALYEWEHGALRVGETDFGGRFLLRGVVRQGGLIKKMHENDVAGLY